MRHAIPTALLAAAAIALLPAADNASVLIVVGPSNHPPGSHEVAAGARLLADALGRMANVDGVRTSIVYEWPSDERVRESASTVIFVGDTFPANRFDHPARNLEQLGEMMDRGCGIVCLHYATGLLGEDVARDGRHPLLQWIGGYFANRSCAHHQSVARVYPEAIIEPVDPSHPVSRGWKAFSIHDEPYINNYFGGPGNRLGPHVRALAASMLPPDAPQREVVAWGLERPDGGRGFGIVMPHYYKNWADINLRRIILNAVVWTAGLDVPPGGVVTPEPDLEAFSPDSVEFVPRRRVESRK